MIKHRKPKKQQRLATGNLIANGKSSKKVRIMFTSIGVSNFSKVMNL